MNQLTPFERALLAQFETLAESSKTSLEASEATSKQLRTLSETVRKRLDSIEQKQREIEHFQTQLLRSLNTHSEQTTSLVKQVNALLDE
jgi:DNA anti-recombination protein RmuC